MSIYILPILFISIFVIGLLKKVPLYDTFSEGAKEAVKLVLSIFPFICAVFIAIELFRVSGLSAKLSEFLTPVLNAIGIPGELAELMVVRPLSGNGSITIIQNLMDTHGADSYIARCACVIVGCSDTIFYISAIYFSTTKVKKLRYAIPVAVFSCFVGAVISCLICRFL